jgi:calcineurin-like phosphoesterase family protein
MNNNAWIVSDHHFGHSNLLNFKKDDGSPLRPEFRTVEEMDQHMIECWNSVVGANDRVYHVGDVCFHLRDLDRIMPQLKGRIVLIKGNHDALSVNQYMKYFDDIRASDRIANCIVSHIPIHPESLGGPKNVSQIHGHLHYRAVQKVDPNFAGKTIDDPRYFNVSVERINYTPIAIEEVLKIFKDRGL